MNILHVTLLQENGKAVSLAWQSKKLSQVTKSLLTSEAMALGEGAGVKHLIANILQQKCSLPKIPKIKYMTDHT